LAVDHVVDGLSNSFPDLDSWIIPHFAALTFSPGEREAFRDRKFFFDYYKRSWETAERFFSVYMEDSGMQKRVLQMAKDKIERDVKDPVLRAKLTPNYPWLVALISGVTENRR
jgi:hypothetical protein